MTIFQGNSEITLYLYLVKTLKNIRIAIKVYESEIIKFAITTKFSWIWPTEIAW